MSSNNIRRVSSADFDPRGRDQDKRLVKSFDLELTSRCNNHCRHCFINLPQNDARACSKELTLDEIKQIADHAYSLGATSCLLTGGEPLLREDFSDIYIYLKRKGFLVTLFTNGTLLTEDHATLFRELPPWGIEVTVYGVTRGVYEYLTRTPGSFDRFMRSVQLFRDNKIKVRFKTVIVKSNFVEMQEMLKFCFENTKDFVRCDNVIYSRYDGNDLRNKEIRTERLSCEEIVQTYNALFSLGDYFKKRWETSLESRIPHKRCNLLFHCGIGAGKFIISYDGLLRLCHCLLHPDYVRDLRNMELEDACRSLVSAVSGVRTSNPAYIDNCNTCKIIGLCLSCPGTNYLESRKLDEPVDYFCQVAHALAKLA